MTQLETTTFRALSDPATLSAAKAALLDATATSVLSAARHAICDPTRAQIVRALGVSSLTVTDLTLVIGRQRTVTSQHLRVLRAAGLVEAHRQGRALFYRLATVPAVHVARTALEAAARAGM